MPQPQQACLCSFAALRRHAGRGLLGIFVYGEIRGARLICAWMIGALVLLCGAAALGYYGSAKN